MRYMMIMRSTPEAQAAMAEQNIDFDQMIAMMGRYNEELVEAGALWAGEGLTPPDQGFLVDFNSDPPEVTDKPYIGESFDGFWIIEVPSADEAKRWAAKCPLGSGVTLEVRRLAEATEFPQDNEWVRREMQWRADIAEKQAADARQAAGR